MSAEPFPHLVLDSFASESTLRAVAAGFDEVASNAWVRYDGIDEHGKCACNELDGMPRACREFITTISGATAAKLCEWITGIDGLEGDATLYGGGLHCTERGGFLGIHLDNKRHPQTALARRLNLIVYCTEGWQEEWAGHLELWDRACSRPVTRVAPLWNRAVLFETSAHSFHGHPEPLRCPPGVRRKSVAVYFWSAPRARARFFARADEPHDAPTEAARLARSRAGR